LAYFYVKSEIDNTPLAVQEFGNRNGRPLVFIHGFSQSYWCWKKQFHDPRLSKFRMVAFDLRGHGCSGKPLDEASYLDSRMWASDLRSIIRSLDIIKPVIVSWSYSGLIVCDYLRHNGDSEIAGINFVGARTKVGTPEAKKMSGSLFLDLAPGFCSENSEDRLTAVYEFLINLTNCNIPYPDIYEMLGYNLCVPARICRVLLERVADNDTLITKLKIPTLITHGDRDTSVLLSMAHHNHSLIKNSVLSIYNKTGHAPFYEDPHRFSEELQEFTNQCSNT
tara:strand:+ start:3215 stop:4051 length:837 start_codon:yes stop_codon:yes gene_type:complete